MSMKGGYEEPVLTTILTPEAFCRDVGRDLHISDPIPAISLRAMDDAIHTPQSSTGRGIQMRNKIWSLS